MLLNEFEELKVSGSGNHREMVTKSGIENKAIKRDNKILGAGIEAVVYQKQGARGMGVVTKVITVYQDVDRSSTIQYLLRGAKLGNPFIPVVYEIKKVVDSTRQDEMYVYYVKMEKLHKTLDDIDLDIHQAKALLNQVCHLSDEIVLSDDVEQIKSIIVSAFDWNSTGLVSFEDDTGNVRELQMRKSAHDVLQLYRQVARDTLSDIDMHAGNLMIRLTGVGMQLVVTDPVLS